MNRYVSDPLESFGTVAGVLLVLVGLATLVGMPWANKSGSVVLMFGQVLGALAAVAIGVALAWLARA